MVSTRGGARTGADDQAVPELTLRKKPVRKAATTTKTAKAAPAKTTRSKKTEPEPEDEEADELQGEETVVAPKVVRKGRAKKDESSTTTAAPSKPTAASRARTTTAASKAATTRNAKTSKVETETPDLPPPTQAKATRATRATASTRATAAKEKVAPLSPKKITQVPKAPARSTRTANTKPAVTKGSVETAPKSKLAGRRRGESDENAGVPQRKPTTAKQQPASEIKAKPGVKGRAAVKKVVVEPAIEPEAVDLDNDTPMSTRPTTPADSPQPELEEVEEQEIQESESDEGTETEKSADELCGPKTPMKRLSPREGSKYASAQKAAREEEVSMKTPVRRFLVLGSQRGTPQTQKPYCKPALPLSEVRPTTVARARDRAMVFPELQPMEATRGIEEDDETADDEHSTTDMEREPSEDDGSFAEDNNMAEVTQADDSALAPVAAAGTTIEESHNLNEESGDLVNDTEDYAMSDAGHDVHELETVAIPFQMKSLAEAEDEITAEAEADATEDPNETILAEDQEMEDHVELQADASFGSEESVIVRHEMAAGVEESFIIDDLMEDIRLPATTPKPETIVWENLREDVTIPFNFDSELSAARDFTSASLDEETNIATSGDLDVHEASEIVLAGDRPPTDVNVASADTQYNRQSFGDVRISLDATVNLSDFLDVSSLAERSQTTHQAIMDDEEVDLDGQQAESEEPQVEIDAQQLEPDKGVSHGDVARALVEDPARPAHIPSTPARESVLGLPNVPQHEPQQMLEANTPHYAMPTIAFRRKSLPAIIYHTPMKNGARPQTSDGASIPRLANPFLNLSAAQNGSQQEMTPFRRRLSTAQGFQGLSRPQTPSLSTPARSKTPRTSGRAGAVQTPRASQTPRTSSRLSVKATPKERFPGLPSRQTYEELATTPAAKTPRLSTPSAAVSSTKERFPGLPPAESYEQLVKTPASTRSPAKTAVTPHVEHLSSPIEEAAPFPPQQEERYPGLPHRRTYEEHAKTAMPPSRFRTPSQSPVKRPATVQRPASLRKLALRAATPRGSHTPVKTPLKAPAMTPGQVPLTPHPGAPLKGVNAYVDVFLNDGSSANSTYIAVLHSLGAKTTKTFNDRVTHVIFKEGSPATLQRLRLHNKQVTDSATGNTIFCVNGRWVNDSNSEGARMDETDEAYAVDIEDQRATKRRRKSMEPTSLLNIGGNVVRDTNRKSSLGRSSIGRTLKAGSPAVGSPIMAMSMDVAEKENSGDSSFGDESPATPAYLAAPDSLVQQTAPMNRVRKLDFDAQEQAKNRRLTFWDGGEF